MRKEAVARAGSFAALVLLCATAPAAVATPNITTVAGNGLAGYDGESVAATTAVSSPAAVAADLAGQLLIVDNNQQITRLVDTSGVMTTASGNPGVTGGNCGTGPNVFSDFAALAGPLDVIWGRTLTGAAINGFYLADTNSNCIRIVDMDQFSGSTSFAGNGTGGISGDGGKPTDAELSGPRGVAQDPTGVMWISDTGNGRIRRVRDNSGTKVIDTVAGCSSSCLGTADDIDPLKAQLSSPQGIASISANQFVFADAGTRRIRKVTLDPADPTLSRITTVAGTGALGSSGDGGPATSARLASPADVAVATGGGLVIADTGNNRIRYVSPGGTISTIAGGGGPGSFSGDGGPADQAFLNTPTSVQPTPDGLLIADLANRRVRRVDATGVTGGTGAFTGSTTANMSFESWDAAAQFECSIDNGAFQTCTSPASFSNLDEGTHLLEVRALDPGGAPDPTPATRSVTVDLTPPAAFGLVAPVDRGFTPAQANFSWESTTDGSSGLDHFELWIDGAKQSDVNLKACSTGTCVGGGDYSEGSHSWQIKAVDAVGNVRSSSVRDFTVDATPPGAALLGTPPDSAFTTGTPTFSWSSVADSGSGVDHYELVIDGSKDSDIAPGACSATCQAPATLGLPLAGTHTWAVRAVDAVGNASESTTRAFTVDSIPPDVFTPAAPADGAVVPGQAVYSWPPANDSLSGVDHYDLVFDAVTGGTSSSQTVQPGTCSVNACSAQVTKAEGDYTWHVTATDGVGNARDTVARSLHVDSTPPDAFLAIAPADAAAVAGTASFSWQATTDAVAGVDH
ncbi:MAG: trimeric autotransporter adhesin, partial [Thermoleophilaceae bacterium]|nr:trimeric autotransporter adhesin [Thermoleophilaceae bacterium]